jgi:hypothetical protein
MFPTRLPASNKSRQAGFRREPQTAILARSEARQPHAVPARNDASADGAPG